MADRYHARTDGITSLAAVLDAVGVWMGFPLDDPIIGLLITIAIFAIVWQSSRAVITCMLDGVDPRVVEELQPAAGHVPGNDRVLDTKARHKTLRCSPEMAAGLSSTLWSMADVVALIDPVAEPVKARGPYKPRSANMA